MDIILTVFLPLSLAFIMFSLGLGLTLGDFARVFKQPKAFAIGAISQLIVLPVTAFMLLQVFELNSELAVGVMILAFSPGGVTSNIITKLAGGALALSITLTGVISLFSVLTVPFLVAWSADHFMGQAAPQINVTSLAIAMFMITAVPVAFGVAIRHFAGSFATRVEPNIMRLATLLFVVIVIGALAGSWDEFMENVIILAPLLLILNVLLLTLGYGVAKLMNLNHAEAVAISIETGVQNSTLGITVGSLIMEAANGLPPFSLPSGVYGITMYFVAIPFVWWMRSKKPK